MSDEDIDVGSKIRAYRKSRNLSLTELSRRTGIAASNLSSIELNKTSPTLGTIIKIADAFGMKAALFLDEVLYRKAVVCRSSGMLPSEGIGAGTEQFVLTDGVMLNRMDARLIVLARGRKGIPVENPGTDRFVYCLDGDFTVHVDREDYHLSTGDSMYLLPEAAAVLSTCDEAGARILIVNTPGRKCARC
ncbi:MAG: helix-turn-helix domain-containing protein [Pseudomonadota bacterium]